MVFHGTIEGIYRTPVAGGVMESVLPDESVQLWTNRGMEGDRYANHLGTYSCLRVSKRHPGEREPGRQLTMISADSVEAAWKRNNHNNNPKNPDGRCRLPMLTNLGDLRRNLVLRGITADQLLDSIGCIVEIGKECRIGITRHCVPCMYNERKNQIPGLMEGLWKEAGVSCQILSGGMIAVGDSVVITAIQMEHGVDDGDQSPGFYIPPSQRSAEMVKQAKDRMRRMKQELLAIDPEGVERAERSYNSVGLTFWPKHS
jgi:MOSC domain-containing protein YiiM